MGKYDSKTNSGPDESGNYNNENETPSEQNESPVGWNYHDQNETPSEQNERPIGGNDNDQPETTNETPSETSKETTTTVINKPLEINDKNVNKIDLSAKIPLVQLTLDDFKKKYQNNEIIKYNTIFNLVELYNNALDKLDTDGLSKILDFIVKCNDIKTYTLGYDYRDVAIENVNESLPNYIKELNVEIDSFIKDNPVLEVYTLDDLNTSIKEVKEKYDVAKPSHVKIPSIDPYIYVTPEEKKDIIDSCDIIDYVGKVVNLTIPKEPSKDFILINVYNAKFDNLIFPFEAENTLKGKELREKYPDYVDLSDLYTELVKKYNSVMDKVNVKLSDRSIHLKNIRDLKYKFDDIIRKKYNIYADYSHYSNQSRIKELFTDQITGDIKELTTIVKSLETEYDKLDDFIVAYDAYPSSKEEIEFKINDIANAKDEIIDLYKETYLSFMTYINAKKNKEDDDYLFKLINIYTKFIANEDDTKASIDEFKNYFHENNIDLSKDVEKFKQTFTNDLSAIKSSIEEINTLKVKFLAYKDSTDDAVLVDAVAFKKDYFNLVAEVKIIFEELKHIQLQLGDIYAIGIGDDDKEFTPTHKVNDSLTHVNVDFTGKDVDDDNYNIDASKTNNLLNLSKKYNRLKYEYNWKNNSLKRMEDKAQELSIELVEDKIVDYKPQIDEINTSLATINQSIIDLGNKEHKDFTTDVQTITTGLNDVNVKLSALSSSLPKDNSVEVNSLISTVKTLNESVAELQSNKPVDYSNSIGSLEIRIANLAGKIDNLPTNESIDYQENIDAIMNEVVNIQRDVSSSMQDLASTIEDIDVIRKDVISSKTDVEAIKLLNGQQIEANNKQIESLNETIEANKAKINEIITASGKGSLTDDEKDAIEKLKQGINESKAGLKAINDTTLEFNESIKEVTSTVNDKLDKLTTRVEALENGTKEIISKPVDEKDTPTPTPTTKPPVKDDSKEPNFKPTEKPKLVNNTILIKASDYPIFKIITDDIAEIRQSYIDYDKGLINRDKRTDTIAKFHNDLFIGVNDLIKNTHGLTPTVAGLIKIFSDNLDVINRDEVLYGVGKLINESNNTLDYEFVFNLLINAAKYHNTNMVNSMTDWSRQYNRTSSVKFIDLLRGFFTENTYYNYVFSDEKFNDKKDEKDTTSGNQNKPTTISTGGSTSHKDSSTQTDAEEKPVKPTTSDGGTQTDSPIGKEIETQTDSVLGKDIDTQTEKTTGKEIETQTDKPVGKEIETQTDHLDEDDVKVIDEDDSEEDEEEFLTQGSPPKSIG